MSAAIDTPTAPAQSAGTARGQAPPRQLRSWSFVGLLKELRRRPIDLFWRVRNECGETGEMNFAGNRVVLLSGSEAQEAFFRGSDEQLDQAAAYPFMTPVFGRGVVFGTEMAGLEHWVYPYVRTLVDRED